MKTKDYEKPTCLAIEIAQECFIATSTAPAAANRPEGYGEETDILGILINGSN